MALDFDKSNKICILAMKYTFTYPEELVDLKWFLKFIIAYSTALIVDGMLLYNMCYWIAKNNFLRACENSIVFMSIIGVNFNLFILLRHRSNIKEIIKIVKRDIELFKFLPKHERDIVTNYSEQQNVLCKRWLMIYGIAALMFHVRAIGLTVYSYIIGDFNLHQILDLVYISYVDKIKDLIPVYLIMYFLMTYTSAYSTVVHMGLGPLGPVFMLHACGRLNLIKGRLENLHSGDLAGVNERLNNIARELQETYSFVNQIQTCFSFYYEMVLQMTTYLLPIALYVILQSYRRDGVSLQFPMFLGIAVITSAYPCYYSNLLMEKGEEVRLATYSCGWEGHFDRRVRSSLLLILTRTSRPVVIRAVFRTIDLIALSEVFQQAYAIFNLMNATL